MLDLSAPGCNVCDGHLSPLARARHYRARASLFPAAPHNLRRERTSAPSRGKQGGAMRMTLRLLGLDLLDLSIETDATSDDPGDCTTSSVGFTMPEAPPLEVVMPEWR